MFASLLPLPQGGIPDCFQYIKKQRKIKNQETQKHQKWTTKQIIKELKKETMQQQN